MDAWMNGRTDERTDGWLAHWGDTPKKMAAIRERGSIQNPWAIVFRINFEVENASHLLQMNMGFVLLITTNVFMQIGCM